MPRSSAADQARRMLVLIGLLRPQTEVPLAALARAMGVGIEQVARDLELLSLCGIAPYYPNDLVPLYVEGDSVTVYGAMPALERRVRLSQAEAQALAAALQAAGRTADDPLVTRLLAAASETDAHDIERLVRAAATSDPKLHATLAVAIDRRETLRIRYQSGGSEESAERVVEPVSLLNERGVWYVEAYCRTAGAMRTFRVDRIRSAEPTGQRFEHRSVIPSGTAVPPAGLARALVRFAPGVEVPERDWPGVRIVSQSAEGTLVEVPYAGTGWIARQVASFLGGAEAIEPDEVRAAVRALATSEGARLDPAF